MWRTVKITKNLPSVWQVLFFLRPLTRRAQLQRAQKAVTTVRYNGLKEAVAVKNNFFFFFFCLTWHRGGKCGELLRSPKTSPECGFVALRQVFGFFFSPFFKAGTATTGSDNLLQLCLDWTMVVTQPVMQPYCRSKKQFDRKEGKI